MPNKQTEIDSGNAFVHIVYEYRCLVRAEFLYRNSKSINSVFQEVGTTARNAVLSKARSLIDFYTKEIGGRTPPTDITLYDCFGIRFDSLKQKTTKQAWIDIKRSIEANDLHLTAYRDESYRSNYLILNNHLPEEWKDWDRLQSQIVDELVELLNLLVALSPQWQNAFLDLYQICKRVLQHGGSWESDLSDPQSITQYLKAKGIT